VIRWSRHKGFGLRRKFSLHLRLLSTSWGRRRRSLRAQTEAYARLI